MRREGVGIPARCPPTSPTWLLLQGGVGNNPHERMRGWVVLTHEDVCVFNGCNRRTNQLQTKRLCPRLELLASMSVSSFCEINLFSWIKKLKSIPFFGWCKDISDKTSDHVSRLHTFSNSTVNYTADQMIPWWCKSTAKFFIWFLCFAWLLFPFSPRIFGLTWKIDVLKITESPYVV